MLYEPGSCIKHSFEAKNCNIIKVRSESHNTIVQLKTQAKPIDLSRTAHLQFRVLNLIHESDVHSRPGANQRKKRESSALTAAVQPTPKRDSVPQHCWENRSETALADDRRRLLEELTGPDGVIDEKLRGLVSLCRWEMYCQRASVHHRLTTKDSAYNKDAIQACLLYLRW